LAWDRSFLRADLAQHIRGATMGSLQRTAVALALAGAFALVLATVDPLSLDRGDVAAQAAVPTASPSAEQRSGQVAALPDFSELVSQYGPAVVNISVVQGTKQAAQAQKGSKESDEDQVPPMFRNFPFQFQFPQPGPVRGLGSGFIVSGDGIILTNAHVVADADEVTVKLTDRREFKAKVLGSDKTTDVAVLKIDAHNLPMVRIGNSDQIRVGE